MKESPLMVGLGEVLWDVFPSGKVLGGAPTNFAYMASVFGNRGIVASRLGNDDLGRDAYRVMNSEGVDTYYVQYDDQHDTGIAGVVLDSEGQPNFTIKEQVAWDFLQWTPAWEELSARVDVVCYGSLAQRSEASAVTIEHFLRNTPSEALRICDANLREPFYSVDTLRRSLHFADILKLNEQELFKVASLLGIGDGGEVELAKRLFRAFDLELICITKGSRGSLLVSEHEVVEHKELAWMLRMRWAPATLLPRVLRTSIFKAARLMKLAKLQIDLRRGWQHKLARRHVSLGSGWARSWAPPSPATECPGYNAILP
jgi:fructokinase